MKKIQQRIALISLFAIMAVSSTVYGGMRSIFIGEPTEPQCRNCHDNVAEFPMLKHRNPDRHHLLIGSIIPPISQSKAPDALGAKNSGTPYNCFSCHYFATNPETGTHTITEPFRDCLQCHPVWRVTGSPMTGRNVHHFTQTFQQRRCHVCHGGGGMGGGGMRR